MATAKASADRHRAEAYSNLVRARVHVPGLPLLSVVEVEKVTSKAVCEAGRQPVAESNLLGRVTVLGKRTTLSTGGTTRVEVPGVGEVTLDLSKTHTTSRTAAATALELRVSVNPAKLNVAEVTGSVTLAEAKCESPGTAHDESKPAAAQDPTAAQERSAAQDPTAKPGTGVKAQSGADPARDDLAETGGSAATSYIAGGAALLLALGGSAMVLARARARR